MTSRVTRAATRCPFGLALVFFFATGLAALVWENLWVRQLTLVFGNTVQATATVLAAFMGGLALGSWLIGRWLDRTAIRPLKIFGALAAGTALFALAFPLSLNALTPLNRALYRSAGELTAALALTRFLTAFLFLLIPTAFMGGTLPALAKSVVTRRDEVGSRLGALYSINTLGGVAGVVVCGFVLIPNLGLQRTDWLASAINFSVAAVAFVMALRPTDSRQSSGPQLATTPESAAAPVSDDQPRRRLVLAAYFVTGAVALGLEVIWVRVLLLVFGNTTYAFTVMLGTFLAGIALGAMFARGWVAKRAAKTEWLAVLLMTNGVLIAATVWLVDALPAVYLKGLAQFGTTWGTDTLMKAVVSVVLMGAPTFLFGTIFPVVAQLAVRAPNALGRQVGVVYAVNTVGAILGSLLGGFVLLPALGMQCSINALAACLTLAGVVLLVTSRSWRVGARLAWAAVLLVALGVLAGAGKPWDPKLLSAGVYMTPQVFLSEGRYVATGRELSQQRLLYFAEGNTCAVSVVEGDGLFKSLRVDGKVQISTWTSDRRIGRLMGHLPMLLHPQPHTVFNLGLGGGLTVAAMAAHPVTRIDVAEIEPLVVNAAREFAAENRHVLDDARLRLIFNDGRNHILLTDQRYDVITSDPIEPIVAGVGNLFSREYFRLCRDRLAPDGLMCQWVPLYELGPRHFDSIVNAFAAAFPHIMIWFTGTDTILIGSMEPLAIDFERLAQRVSEPSVQRDLQDIGMADANRILGAFCYEIARGDKCNPAAPTNTDDFPFIEFSTPKERWQPTLQLNIQNLFRLKQSLPAHVSFPNAAARQQAEQFFRAHQLALRAMIENQRAEWDRAFAFAQEARALDPQNPAVIALLVGWHVDQAVRAEKVNDTARMLEHYRSAAALDPKEFGPQMRLAWANTERQEWSEAESWLQRALQLAPRAIEARLCAAIIRNGKGDTDGAGDQLRALLQDYPTHPGALLTLAQIEMRLSAFGDAEQRIRLALEQDARDADAHWLLAQLFAATQRPQLARKHFRHALHYGGLIYEQRAASDSVFQRTMRGAH